MKMIIVSVVGIAMCTWGASYYAPTRGFYFALMLFGVIGWAITLGWVLARDR